VGTGLITVDDSKGLSVDGVGGLDQKRPKDGNCRDVGTGLIAVDDSEEPWECCEHGREVLSGDVSA